MRLFPVEGEQALLIVIFKHMIAIIIPSAYFSQPRKLALK